MEQTIANKPSSWRPDRIDIPMLAVVVVLGLASLFIWSTVRSRVVAPLDSVVIDRVCLGYAPELDREQIGSQRVGRTGILNRYEGFCEYGPGPEGEAPITLPLAEIETSSGYGASLWLGLIIELGVVSMFLRITVDPAMHGARWLYQRFRREGN